jgi:hypothetical protein
MREVMQSPRSYFVNVLLAFVPDLAVGWIAMRITDSGWSGFFLTLIALQAVYFFFWLKTALWTWLLFWIYGKRAMANVLENFFIDNRFPHPDKYLMDLDDYYYAISNNEALNCSTRVKAAFENGTLNGLKAAHRFSAVMRFYSAGKLAMERYGRLADQRQS